MSGCRWSRSEVTTPRTKVLREHSEGRFSPAFECPPSRQEFVEEWRHLRRRRPSGVVVAECSTISRSRDRGPADFFRRMGADTLENVHEQSTHPRREGVPRCPKSPPPSTQQPSQIDPNRTQGPTNLRRDPAKITSQWPCGTTRARRRRHHCRR